jgi:hypothetical protein
MAPASVFHPSEKARRNATYETATSDAPQLSGHTAAILAVDRFAAVFNFAQTHPALPVHGTGPDRAAESQGDRGG